MNCIPSRPANASLRVTSSACLLAALFLFSDPVRGQLARQRTSPLASDLEAIKATVAKEVTAQLQRTNYTGSYTTVWRLYEDAAISALCEILPKHIPALTEKNFDRGKSGREKNRLADLAIIVGGEQIEISIKAARRSANPENDMGTFRDHPNRKKLFAASFTLWVRYDDSGKEIKCDQSKMHRAASRIKHCDFPHESWLAPRNLTSERDQILHIVPESAIRVQL